MAKNVVLKDIDGNELNVGKLYRYNFSITFLDDSDNSFRVEFYLSNSKNLSVNNLNEFINNFGESKYMAILENIDNGASYSGLANIYIGDNPSILFMGSKISEEGEEPYITVESLGGITEFNCNIIPL